MHIAFSNITIASAALSIIHIAIVLVMMAVIAANRRPSSAIAWIFAIVFIPYLGAIAFLLIGFGRLPKRRRELQRQVNEVFRELGSVTTHRVVPPEPPFLESAVTLNNALGCLPMVTNNTAHLLDDYDTVFTELADDIDKATTYVHVEFYIFILSDATQPFFDALARAADRGVEVRVLYDHFANLNLTNHRATNKFLRDHNIPYHAMLPLRPWKGQWQRPDMRNHRKIVVIDGRVGYAGSQNLIDKTYLKPKNIRHGLHWKELVARFTGPVVLELDGVFATDWYSETKEVVDIVDAVGTYPSIAPQDEPLNAQVVPSGPSFENDNNLKLFTMLMSNARHRVSITSPYFVPDDATLLTITATAARGIDVELFVSEVKDQFFVYHAQRSYYDALLDAGVKIYLYRAPTVLHSKHFTIDDDVAVIGSSNMDIRSFSLNMEVSVLVQSKSFVDRMRDVETAYRNTSKLLDPVAWRGRPYHQKLRDNLARLTSYLQ